MRTNKNCPKYGEDSEARADTIDLDRVSGRPKFLDQIEPSQQKPLSKKLMPKNGTKIAVLEAPDDDKPTSKAKILKVKCGMTDKIPERHHTPPTSQSSERPMTSDADTGSKSAAKVNKITFSNKMKPDDVETPKSSFVIKPPVDGDREQSRKKLIIKKPREIINFDENSQDGSFGFDYRKTKKINELSSLDKHMEYESKHLFEESSRMRDTEGNQSWVEEKRRTFERPYEEGNRRGEKMKMIEDQPKYELLRYEEGIRREREEEERRRAKEKKKKKRKFEIKDEYFDDLPSRRNDKRIPDRDRMVRRRVEPDYGKHTPDYAPAIKRRRGGEVSSLYQRILQRPNRTNTFVTPVSLVEFLNVLKCLHP